ncbi:glycosyltransferase [Flavobacterium sp. LMO8]|uniref:glycosyltransferase family 2 protein n=1 Tax=Flavobacterium sp. LMO8 TaxID=2654244 RepID=UPI0012909530|nr:glycosyltransferase family A protein [Flavobacterium sp. LMO8]MQP24756.1 glycosyltransferase [Flavobacterium sp. LMO8]
MVLVSIIIPVHQVKDFFKDCVASALQQTYTNIEVLITCNGNLSIDECKAFLNIEDERLIYLSTDSGRHNARNKGMIEAKGDFILFLDYDDILFPNKISNQLNEINFKPLKNHILIAKWKKFKLEIEENYNFPFPTFFEDKINDSKGILEKLAKTGGFFVTTSWMISKDICNQIKWLDSPNDDANFFFKALVYKPTIIMTSEILSGCRIHTDNTSSIRNRDEFDKLIKSWDEIYYNLQLVDKENANYYLFQIYLILIRYSKEINNYKLFQVNIRCLYYGLMSKKIFSVFRKLLSL